MICFRTNAQQTLAWGQEEDVGRNLDKFPHRLQLYSIPPDEDISLEEFETMAIERLKGLDILLYFTHLSSA